jgi:inosine-uridine nucleoside N-ribohydrolase
MNILKKEIISIFFLFSMIHSQSQVKIIFDTDFGGDADDLGALAMLHYFVDQKECDLIAVMCWSTEKYAVSAIDAINRFYSHPDIPIGVRKDSVFIADWHYNKPIVDKLGSNLTFKDVPDATELYRKILSQQKDTSIVIVTVGPLMNIKKLLESKPDSFSYLSGKELVHQKVQKFVVMGGKFPEGKNEWNFNGNMPGVTKSVLGNLELPVVFSGFEIGVQIKTGEAFNKLDKDHPLYLGFYHFSKHAPWMKEYYKGEILNNSSYDQTAVLYAVKNGEGKLWDKVENGHCHVDENGDNKWISGKKTNHSYLKLMEGKNDELAKLINSLMLGDE